MAKCELNENKRLSQQMLASMLSGLVYATGEIVNEDVTIVCNVPDGCTFACNRHIVKMGE